MNTQNKVILIKKNEKMFDKINGTPIRILNEENDASILIEVEKMSLLDLLKTLEPYFPTMSNMVGLYFNYYLKKLSIKNPNRNYSEVHLIKNGDHYSFKYKHNENDILNGYILKCSELNSYANATVFFESQISNNKFTLFELVKTLAMFLETFNRKA